SGSAQDRRMWIEIQAFKNGTLFYSSGVVPDGMPATMNPDTGHLDDYWLLRDCMLDPSNHEVSMFWQAASVEAVTAPMTYLLPAQVTTMALDPPLYWSHIMQSYPHDKAMHLPQMPDRVTLRVRLQPVGLDVLDDLVASNDLDPAIRAAMPTYDVDLDQ